MATENPLQVISILSPRLEMVFHFDRHRTIDCGKAYGVYVQPGEDGQSVSVRMNTIDVNDGTERKSENTSPELRATRNPDSAFRWLLNALLPMQSMRSNRLQFLARNGSTS